MDKRFLTIDELTHLPAPQWLIEGLFEANALVMLAGAPAAYKSFMALDWMLSMSSGRKWNQRTTVPSKCLYALGEGKSSLVKRVGAWTQYNKVSEEEQARLNDNFRVTFDVPQLTSKASVDNLLAGLDAENFRPTVIVIDTLARSFVGMDENSQRDAGMWIESAERLRSLGHTVIWLHHTAKNVEFGPKYRGSSVILGAVDTAMIMQREQQNRLQVALTITKQKDHDEGEPMHFNVVKVKSIGNSEGSCVLLYAPKMDERYTEEGIIVEEEVKKLLLDESFESDWKRAEYLHKLTGMTKSAAQSRISRKRVELGVPKISSVKLEEFSKGPILIKR